MDTYILVLWPESQTYMDEPWFDDEAVLADYESIGEYQAYFIPAERILSPAPSTNLKSN